MTRDNMIGLLVNSANDREENPVEVPTQLLFQAHTKPIQRQLNKKNYHLAPLKKSVRDMRRTGRGRTMTDEASRQMKHQKLHDKAQPRGGPRGATSVRHILALAAFVGLLSFAGLTKAALFQSSRSFPFKTSFVSSSDNTQLRRNGALASLQLTSLEQAPSQLQYPTSESLLLNIDSSSFEQPSVGGLNEPHEQQANSDEHQPSNHRDRIPLTQNTGGDSFQASATISTNSARANPQDSSFLLNQDDLLAVSSTNSNQTMKGTASSLENSTTTTTLAPTTAAATTSTSTTITTTTTSTTTAGKLAETAATTIRPEISPKSLNLTSSEKFQLETLSNSTNASEDSRAQNAQNTSAPEQTTQISRAEITTSAPTDTNSTTTQQPSTTTMEVANNATSVEESSTTTTTTTTRGTKESDTTTSTTTTRAAAATTTATSVPIATTTTATNLITTDRQKPARASSGGQNEQAASERESRTAGSLASFGGRLANRAQIPCALTANGKCGTFTISKVPTLERPTSSNSTTRLNQTGEPPRLVNEFVFVPEDSGPLELDQSEFVNITTAQQDRPLGNDSQPLKAEHRGSGAQGPDLHLTGANLSSANSSSFMLVNDNGEVELDYINLDDNDKPEEKTIDRLKTTTASSTSTTSTSTTTGKPIAATEKARTSQPPVDSNLKSLSIARFGSPTIKPGRTTGVVQQASSSITVSELQSERLHQAQRQTTTTTPLPATVDRRREQTNTGVVSTNDPTRTTSKTTSKPTLVRSSTQASGRKNNKFLATPEAETSSSVRQTRPKPLIKLDNSRISSARRLSASGQQAQHKQVFNEPSGDWQRRRHGGRHTSETFSPMNNGADEEEASILTRYSLSSQLSRLSSLGRGGDPAPVKPFQQKWYQEKAKIYPGRSTPLPSLTTTTIAATTSTTAAPSRGSVPTSTSTTTTTTGWTSPAFSGATEDEFNRTTSPESVTISRVTAADLIGKIMEEEDKEADLRTAGELVMTLIASSSPATSKTDEPQRASTEPFGTPSASSLIEAATTRATTTSTTTTTAFLGSNTTGGASASTLLSQSRQVAATTPKSQSQKTPAPVTVAPTTTSTTTTTEAAQNDASNGSDVERLVDQVIEEQLERDTLENKRPASRSDRLASSYSSNSPAGRPKKAVKSQVLVIKTGSNNPHDYDSGKWQPDTNVDYSLVSQDGDYARQANTATLGAKNTNQADSLPGRAGVDYPVHWQVPKTSFDCRNYEQSGFYADVESDCQAYHSCHRGRGGRHTFLCPNGTLFSQELLTCDWWYNVECSQSKFYMPNSALPSSSAPSSSSSMDDEDSDNSGDTQAGQQDQQEQPAKPSANSTTTTGGGQPE